MGWLALGLAVYIALPVVGLLAGRPGVEVLLGAVAAGAVWRAILRRRDARYTINPAWGRVPRESLEGGGERPDDAVFAGGPYDGRAFLSSGATLVEVPDAWAWHRYLPNGARAGGLDVYAYAGVNPDAGPILPEIRLHGTRD